MNKLTIRTAIGALALATALGATTGLAGCGADDKENTANGGATNAGDSLTIALVAKANASDYP